VVPTTEMKKSCKKTADRKCMGRSELCFFRKIKVVPKGLQVIVTIELFCQPIKQFTASNLQESNK